MTATHAQTPRQAAIAQIPRKITPAMREAAKALADSLDLTEVDALAVLVEAVAEAGQ